MQELAAEQVTGRAATTWGGNRFTERGHELEQEALDVYSEMTGDTVEKIGFVRNGTLGCSPDGIVPAKRKGVEIKNRIESVHVHWMQMQEQGKFPSENMKQVQTQLLVTQYDSWDFFSYCPGLPPVLINIAPDLMMQDEIMREVSDFEMELKALVGWITSKF
jgi:hypothetical protein